MIAAASVILSIAVFYALAYEEAAELRRTKIESPRWDSNW